MVIEQINGFIVAYPMPALIIISAVLTLITTILMLHFTDQEHIKNLKKRNKELQKELKACHKKGEHARVQEINQEAMELSLKLMKSSFSVKMLLITLVPFFIIFRFLRGFYIPLYGNWWILYYIVASMVASTIYRKLFKMA